MGKQKHVFVTESEHVLYSVDPYPNLAKYCRLSGTATKYKSIATQKVRVYVNQMRVHTVVMCMFLLMCMEIHMLIRRIKLGNVYWFHN